MGCNNIASHLALIKNINYYFEKLYNDDISLFHNLESKQGMDFGNMLHLISDSLLEKMQ